MLNDHHAFSQLPSAVIMIQPHRFHPNPETLKDNAFQSQSTPLVSSSIAIQARLEVTNAMLRLHAAGVKVIAFEDTGTANTPDSVFPNNWFSTHADGTLVLYPMYCDSRRREFRQDIVDYLLQNYAIKRTIDLRHFAQENQFLEGTGSIVFDHRSRIAYACESKRSSAFLLGHVGETLGYAVCLFQAVSDDGAAIYHTNVMMNLGEQFAMLGADTMQDLEQRQFIKEKLIASGRELVLLNNEQIKCFAGNCLELNAGTHNLLAMSETAWHALSTTQRKTLEKFTQLLPLKLPTIELAGGSIRCMLAGVHLPDRNDSRLSA